MPDAEDTDTTESDVKYDDQEPESRFPGGGGWGRTADYGDAHRSWTVQSARPMPKDAWDKEPITKFHPSELPNPDVAMAAGLKPLINRVDLIDAEHETMPPSGNYPVDHPKREVHRRKVEEAGGIGDQMDEEYKKAKALTQVRVEDADVEDTPADPAV